MILPAYAQILVHSILLVWTAYCLVTNPSVLLESSIVTIFGRALQLVPHESILIQPRFSAMRFADHGLSFAGLTLLYLAVTDTIPLLRRDWSYYRGTSTELWNLLI
jgi:hypothetical protein